MSTMDDQQVAVGSLDGDIRKCRMARIQLTVRGKDGRAVAEQDITLNMVRHKFLFGSNAFTLNPDENTGHQQAYQQHFTRIFNFATLPFYWAGFEPARGQLKTGQIMKQARWLQTRKIRTKGHPLVWRQVFPRWINAGIESAGHLQMARVAREVETFAGVTDVWDVINEVTDWSKVTASFDHPLTHLYQQIGDVELVRRSFETARAANPDAVLLINDYDSSDDYARLIERCLEAGVSIDAIGIQSHMHMGLWTSEATREVLDRFGRFGLPIHFTETTLISGDRKQDINWWGRYDDWVSDPEGEARQARQVVEFYSLLFAHPCVQAITWWDFSDWNAWLGAPAGLIRKDMTPKPAYTALERLIRQEWWTPVQRLRTNRNGELDFQGFLGDYEVESGDRHAFFTVSQCGAVTTVVALE